MEINKYLNNLRSVYEETEPNIDIKLYGWQRLFPKLQVREKPIMRFFYRLSYVGIAVSILIVASLSVYKNAQAALPGTPLYPVKLFSEEVINRANGNNQASIDNRAEEIINLIDQDEQNEDYLRETVRQYSQSVENATVKDDDFKSRLDEQHKEFEKRAEESPEHSEDIREAIEASEINDSEEGDAPEVKGSKDQRDSPSNNNSSQPR